MIRTMQDIFEDAYYSIRAMNAQLDALKLLDKKHISKKVCKTLITMINSNDEGNLIVAEAIIEAKLP